MHVVAAAVPHAEPQAVPLARKRILIVDDEALLLKALSRSFIPLKKEWETLTATSAAEAVKLFEAQPFDVIITDMRMPGTDGAALLEEVRRRWPATVRMIHSGEAQDESRIRAMGNAHQFLAKPWAAATVQEQIIRIFQLRAALASDELRAAVAGVDVLPSQAQMLERLRRAVASDRTDVAALVEIIGTDIALTAKLLQTVNSAFFALARRITKVEEAITYLGFSTVRSLAQAQNVLASFRDSVLVDAVQKHSGLVAQVAKAIAPPMLKDDAFSAGLLHDVGKLVLADAKLPQESAPQPGLVGAALLQTWGLPWALVEAVAHHNDPLQLEQPGELTLSEVVAVAHQLVDAPAETTARLLSSARFAAHQDAVQTWSNAAQYAVAKGK